MKLTKPVFTIGVTVFAALVSNCTRDAPKETPSPVQGNAVAELSAASRSNSHPVYSHYLSRFRTRVVQLENRVVALNRASEDVKDGNAAQLMEAISEFESHVQRAREDFELLRKEGPSPTWEETRDRIGRTIVTAERTFDSLALRFGVREVEKQEPRGANPSPEVR